MACCYIAATIIGFLIRSCDALDIDLHIQYSDSIDDEHGQYDAEQLEKEGGEANNTGITVVSISGMTCAACTSTVESALKKVKGVSEALVSLPFQEARVFHDSGTRLPDIVSAITDVGYDAHLGERRAAQKLETLQHTEELATLKYSLKGLSVFSAVIFGLGTMLDYSNLGAWFRSPKVQLGRPVVLFILTVTTAIRHGHWIFRNAWNAAQHLRVNMHTLITSSTVVGLCLTFLSILIPGAQVDAMYFDTIVGVLLIITVGRYMDLLSRRRATDTFAGLYSLLDQTSSVKLAKLNKRVPTNFVRSGDEIIINAFSVVPCDCYVVSGKSHVNEAVITGESRPKTKEEGDLLLAGSRNGPAQLYARVNQDFQGSFLAQIIRSVEDSLSAKVAVQQKIDVITQYFVSAIFAIAIPITLYTYLSRRQEGLNSLVAIDVAGKKLMTILSAACPCALGLATPCAVMAGIDAAWQRGIIMLEGGETMERLCSITHIVMDKTGTLTRGTLTVRDIAINKSWDGRRKELATLICAAEEKGMSAHPLAMAIFRRLLPMSEQLWSYYQDIGGLKDLVEASGKGVKCNVDSGDGVWRTIYVGSLQWMKENEMKGTEGIPLHEDIGSVVFVGIDGQIAASLVLQDVIREDAKSTIDALKARGLKLSMLTGDQPAEARRISKELGIAVLDSAATPDVKLKHIKSIQDQGGEILMVGDGMNDGPSLAAANVGVMISNGRKCFTSGGSVLLLQPHLESLISLLDIATRTMVQVRRNITWVIVYNVIAVALASGLGAPFGLTISPPMAAAMMSASSLFVTVQGLLLRNTLAPVHKES